MVGFWLWGSRVDHVNSIGVNKIQVMNEGIQRIPMF